LILLRELIVIFVSAYFLTDRLADYRDGFEASIFRAKASDPQGQGRASGLLG